MTSRHSTRLARVERAIVPPVYDGPTIIWGSGPDARVSTGPAPQGGPIILWGGADHNDTSISPNQ